MGEGRRRSHFASRASYDILAVTGCVQGAIFAHRAAGLGVPALFDEAIGRAGPLQHQQRRSAVRFRAGRRRSDPRGLRPVGENRDVVLGS